MIIELKEKYKVVAADEGMKFTEHTGDDFTNYNSWSKAILGLTVDVSSWREITIEEDMENIRKQEQQLIAKAREENGNE